MFPLQIKKRRKLSMLRLNLSSDELLATTRSVRKRLDFTRPVEPEVIQECLELAVQAPTGGNRQIWHFIVVTDAKQRQELGAIYSKGFRLYREQGAAQSANTESKRITREQQAILEKVINSSDYLAEHMHEVPVMLVPCVWGRVDNLPPVAQAGVWGSILPATWSFMLAARER